MIGAGGPPQNDHSNSQAHQQAWAILTRHARDEIEPLRLQELCRDNDRVSSLVAVYNTTSEAVSTWITTNSAATDHRQPTNNHANNKSKKGGENRILIADLSRQRMTLETLNHLLKLATARNLREFITQLAWGQNDPRHPILLPDHNTNNGARTTTTTRFQDHIAWTPSTVTTTTSSSTTSEAAYHLRRSTRRAAATSHSAARRMAMPSMHLALRVPAGKGYEMLTTTTPTDPTLGVGASSSGSSSSATTKNTNNALTAIHREWDRLERISDSMRRGKLRGVTGSMIRDVVVVGRGVPIEALRFVYMALLKDERAVLASRFGLVESSSSSSLSSSTVAGRIMLRRNLSGSSGAVGNAATGAARRLELLTTVDPTAIGALVSNLDPASTLVISVALNGNEETGLATKSMKSWLLHSLGSNRRADHVLAKHMMLVTGNDRIVSVINKPESVHIIPEHSRCEAFTTFSPATLLPLSIIFGWDIVNEFIAGAHDMDCHFVETNPRHNLPVLLALTDIWNDVFLGASARTVTPYSEAFAGFPAFVGALESQTCSRTAEGEPSPENLSCSAVVVDGGLDSSCDRAFYQAQDVMNTELVMAMDCQLTFNASRSIGVSGMENVHALHDSLVCSLFAHADELAFGGGGGTTESAPPTRSSPSPLIQAPDNDISEGNRPSSLLVCGKLDAFACGQLVALSEHRAIVKAHIWGLDPFVRETGSSLRMHRAHQLKEELQEILTDGVKDDEDEEEADVADGQLNLSTKTLLGHYAGLVRDQRLYTVKGT